MKKLLAMILIMTFILCGCGSDADPQNTVAMPEAAEPQVIQDVIEDVIEETEALLESEVLLESKDVIQSEVSTQSMAEETKENDVRVEEVGETETVVESVEESMEQTAQVAVSAQDAASAQEPAPALSPHSCIWDGGNVISNATCNSEGIKTYTCAGCGSTKTESIAKIAHNYVTESSAATCTEAGKTKTYCSICGNVQSESVGEAATGHVAGPKSYWPKVEGPTCLGGAYYNIYCSECGDLLESGNDPALPHTEVGTKIKQGDCIESTVISYDCSVCGCHIRNESRTEDHNWVPGEADYFNVDTLEWEKVAIMYCTRCNRQQQ